MILKNGRVYYKGSLQNLDISIVDGVIDDIDQHITGEGTDCLGMVIMPLLCDIHTHGCLGFDFAEATSGQFRKMDNFYHRSGVGVYLPTIISSPAKDYKDIAKRLAGLPLRLEGPFLGKAKRGAHRAENLCLPDMALIDELGDQVKMVDIDPTLPGALDTIEQLEKIGMKTSIGHTEATYEEAMAAFDRGCSHVTHLFNAMSPLHHRESGVIGAAYDRKEVTVELICDGYHISPPVLRMAFELFDGRICLISDSYKTMGIEQSGYASLPDGTIAGAVMGINRTVFMLEKWGVPIEKAIKAAAETPLRALGLPSCTIEKGEKAMLFAALPERAFPEWVFIDKEIYGG
ncbi:MAG: hypothetical protein VB078_08805 [Clostridiaceae bacterium]|nr:hypothetical protein [Clostridiaceae bacterium]